MSNVINDKHWLLAAGDSITTACGSADQFFVNTPYMVHEGNWIFFCTPACHQDFIQDQDNSSLANQSNSEER